MESLYELLCNPNQRQSHEEGLSGTASTNEPNFALWNAADAQSAEIANLLESAFKAQFRRQLEILQSVQAARAVKSREDF